jgi:hypothetical protein
MPENEQAYRDMVPILMDGELPAPPPIFRPEPTVIGRPELIEAVEKMLAIAPELRGRVKSIVGGHTTASMEKHMDSELPPDFFGRTNLMGIFDKGKQEIGINPSIEGHAAGSGFGLLPTLAHELLHSAGHDEYNARAGADKLFGSHQLDQLTKR